jgi:glutathionyl-hydroquinone reductase
MYLNVYLDDEEYDFVKKNPKGFVRDLIRETIECEEEGLRTDPDYSGVLKAPILKEKSPKKATPVIKSKSDIISSIDKSINKIADKAFKLKGDGLHTCKTCGSMLTMYKGKCKVCGK